MRSSNVSREVDLLHLWLLCGPLGYASMGRAPPSPWGTDYEPSVIPSRSYSLDNTKLMTAEKGDG